MKNNAISLTRIIAMLMIILCHLSSWLGINVLAQFLNVGVEIFLIISGYLYSNRKIDNPFDFIIQRWKKLCIPMYVVFVILFFYKILVKNNIDVIKTIPVYLLNLQGVGFFIGQFQIPTLIEIGPLWFITIIMINYILLILVKRFERESFWKSKKKVNVVYIILFVVDCILAIFGIQIAYFLVFFIGYAIGKLEIKRKKKSYFILSLGMVLSILIRLIGKIFLDGTIVYNNIIAILTHVVLGLWIYETICLFYHKRKDFCDKICKERYWHWLEEHSMLIYMTHYMFLVGDFNVANLHIAIFFEVIIFAVCVLVFSKLLKIVLDKLNV